MKPDIQLQLIAQGYSFYEGVLPSLEPLKPLKKIPHLSWANPEGTLWFLCYYQGSVVGCAAMTHSDSGVARFKTDATLPEHRGKGIYSALSAMRLSRARALLLGSATCYSTADSRPRFLKDGFTVKGDPHKDIVYMTKTL